MLLQRLLPPPKLPRPRLAPQAYISSSTHIPDAPSDPAPEPEEQEEIEDVFSDSLSLLFPDEIRNQHGLPGSRIIYRSPRHGDIDLLLADPTAQDDRLLFAHYLWNAALVLADLIEGADEDDDGGGAWESGEEAWKRNGAEDPAAGCSKRIPLPEKSSRDHDGDFGDRDAEKSERGVEKTNFEEGSKSQDHQREGRGVRGWSVRGKKILELGAGMSIASPFVFGFVYMYIMSLLEMFYGLLFGMFLTHVYIVEYRNGSCWNHLRLGWC